MEYNQTFRPEIAFYDEEFNWKIESNLQRGQLGGLQEFVISLMKSQAFV